MATVNRQPSVETLRNNLRDAGLRVTPSRVAVLRTMLQSEHPISHADLVDRLQAESWDQATLYRNLNDLVQAGLLQPSASGGRVQRYELAGANSTARHGHAHFVCNGCGAAECIDEITLSAPSRSDHFRRALKDRNFDIQVRGLCDSCAAR